MLRRSFLKRMALAFAATAFVEVSWGSIEERSRGLRGIRDDLADTIYRISPRDTPFASMLTDDDPSAFAWQTDAP